MDGKQIKKDNYTIQVNYSKEAKKKKLIKFISKSGDEFEIPAEEMAEMLIGGVNSDTLQATFVESDRINVVEVGRQLECILEKDMKKGDKFRLNYSHPYPLEFAIIEQVMGIAKVNMDVPALTLTTEYIEEVKKKLKPEQKEYIDKFYKSFKNVGLDKK